MAKLQTNFTAIDASMRRINLAFINLNLSYADARVES